MANFVKVDAAGSEYLVEATTDQTIGRLSDLLSRHRLVELLVVASAAGNDAISVTAALFEFSPTKEE